jgi:hypothetical protein
MVEGPESTTWGDRGGANDQNISSLSIYQITSWQWYDINGYLFYTAAKDKKTVSQNSGVRIEALAERTGQSTTYFGVIDDIWEAHYGSNIQIPVFRCRWVKHPKGVEVDDYGLTIVDLNNVGYKDDLWVLTSQVAQVLYVADLAKKTKHVVVHGKQDIIGVDGIDYVEEYNQYDDMNLFTHVPQKMRIVEANIRKDDKPWARKDDESRILTA